jgi:hypothetical protein
MPVPRPTGAPPPSPPPCWCGRTATDHTPAADHDYTPAQGIESEAYDAW